MNSTIFDRRRAGLLTPVFALRHNRDFGVGDTLAVKQAIDFAAEVGFSVLQVLPIHETFLDFSPYNPISSRALSPVLLHLTPNEVPGLTPEILEQAAPESWLAQLRQGPVRYEAVYPLKTQILLTSHYRFQDQQPGALHAEFEAFRQEQAAWLESYTLFRLLIREYEGNPHWADWRPEHHTYESSLKWLLSHPAREDLELLRLGFAFIQWVAWRQWKDVKEYATQKGVRLLGEVSFGVAVTSADVWANPSLFDRDWSLGTRPLTHFDTSKDAERWGQNWGLPSYRWENHRSTKFDWARGRILWERQFFHGCRLDHLRGYFRAYMFPWAGGARHVEFSNLNEEEAAQLTGGLLPRFIPGPDDDPASAAINAMQGREIIGQLIDAAGDMDLVAELMGEMPEYMRVTMEELQLPSLAFPQLERLEDKRVRAAKDFRELSLVAYANHDNAPLATAYLNWRQRHSGDGYSDLAALSEFIGADLKTLPETLDTKVLRSFQDALFKTNSRLAVLMCSDLLGIPLRFNLPGSYGRGTWSDRLDLPLAEYLKHPDFGPRIEAVKQMIADSGRGLK